MTRISGSRRPMPPTRSNASLLCVILLCALAAAVAQADTCSTPLLTLTGHTGQVCAVAYSPDGSKVLTGSSDDTAKLWNAAAGTELCTFTGHTQAVYSAAFSPDGSKVLTGAWDNTARLWDMPSGVLLHNFTGHTGWVFSAVFSPDGSKVLTGSFDNTAKLWDLATGADPHTFTGHTSYVYSVAFSPDGSKALTGSKDMTVKLWDVATEVLLGNFNGHTGEVNSVAFSPDGTKVLSGAAYPDNTARLWDAATGVVLRSFAGFTAGVWSVAFSPDGTKVLAGSQDNTAKLWDVATGTELRSFTGHTAKVYSVAFSPDGTKVLTGSGDKTAKLWPAFPVTGSIVINSNRTVTKSASVTLGLKWLAGSTGSEVVRMRFSNDGATWSAWEGVASSKALTLPAGDGYKTVRAQYLDRAQNRSDICSDYIRLDTVAPTGGIYINNNLPGTTRLTTTSRAVTLHLNWDDAGSGVVRMRFSDNGSTWTTWETLKATRSHTLPAGLGYHTVRVQYTDAAENYSPVYNDYIKLVAAP